MAPLLHRAAIKTNILFIKSITLLQAEQLKVHQCYCENSIYVENNCKMYILSVCVRNSINVVQMVAAWCGG